MSGGTAKALPKAQRMTKCLITSGSLGAVRSIALLDDALHGGEGF